MAPKGRAVYSVMTRVRWTTKPTSLDSSVSYFIGMSHLEFFTGNPFVKMKEAEDLNGLKVAIVLEAT